MALLTMRVLVIRLGAHTALATGRSTILVMDSGLSSPRSPGGSFILPSGGPATRRG